MPPRDHDPMSERIHLVLAPGLVCDAHVWEHQAQALGDVAHCAIADYHYDNSLAQMAQRVLSSAPERFALAGHSMGGRVALEILRLAPQRVLRVALLDTGYESLDTGAVGDKEREKRFALLEMAKKKGMRSMAKVWAQGMVHPSRLKDAELMNGIYDMLARKTPEHFAAQIDALLNRPDAADVLAAIRCPTLIACGEQDSWSPFARHVAMARRAPHAKLVAIPESGHMVTLERPATVTAALREWLRDGMGG